MRVYTAAPVFSDVPLENTSSSSPYVWGVSSPRVINGSDMHNYFSALCYFFGRNLIRHKPNAIVGLVASSKGGSRIESWMSDESLAKCSINVHTTQSSHAQLYNGNVFPFLNRRAPYHCLLLEWS
eukprot:Opistho-2@80506